MDEVVVRQRYARNHNHYRRKRRNIKYSNTLAETIIRQTLICLAILILVGLLKSLNTGPTNYLTGKIKSTLGYNMEVKSIFQGVDKLVQKAEKLAPGKKGKESGDKSDNESGVEGQETTETQGNETEADNLYVEELESTTGITDQISNSISDENLINSIKTKYTFSIPVQGFLSSPYGNRISPIKKTLAFHQGADIGADTGTTIKAALDGEVVEAGAEAIYGNYIKIKHEDGLETLYAHCSELIAQKGNKVSRGTSIAKVGNTGLSVGAHLHFEIRKDGKTMDPAKFINIPPKTEKEQ